jgi:fused signal recognition particle receptor
MPSWKGIGKRLREMFTGRPLDDEFYLELEDAMIEADMGVRTAQELAGALRATAREKGLGSRQAIMAELRSALRGMLLAGRIELVRGTLNVLLVLGVNGVGKTTTIAKLARYFMREHGVNGILLAAGDTFRAAAADQLKLLGERLSLPVVSQAAGSDPGSVIYDGIASGVSRGCELVIADTAGRLHNKEALVRELAKIDRIARTRVTTGTYRKILVLDATTGQNSLQQADVFHRAVGIDSIVLSKYDSTAKGGMVVPICRELSIPFSFVGVGESLDDLEVFDPDSYLDSLLGGQ